MSTPAVVWLDLDTGVEASEVVSAVSECLVSGFEVLAVALDTGESVGSRDDSLTTADGDCVVTSALMGWLVGAAAIPSVAGDVAGAMKDSLFSCAGAVVVSATDCVAPDCGWLSSARAGAVSAVGEDAVAPGEVSVIRFSPVTGGFIASLPASALVTGSVGEEAVVGASDVAGLFCCPIVFSVFEVAVVSDFCASSVVDSARRASTGETCRGCVLAVDSTGASDASVEEVGLVSASATVPAVGPGDGVDRLLVAGAVSTTSVGVVLSGFAAGTSPGFGVASRAVATTFVAAILSRVGSVITGAVDAE